MSQVEVQDGLVIYGLSRSGANAYPNEHLFNIPAIDTGDGVTPVNGGDLCVLVDFCVSTNATPPTSAYPSGFTSILTVTGTNAAGKGLRANTSYKILTNAELGVNITGMVGTEHARKAVSTFRASRPIQTCTLLDYAYMAPQGGVANPLYTFDPSALASGNIILLGCALGEVSIPDANYNWNTVGPVGTTHPVPTNGNDPKGGAFATRHYYDFTPKGTTPAGVYATNLHDLGAENFQIFMALAIT